MSGSMKAVWLDIFGRFLWILGRNRIHRTSGPTLIAGARPGLQEVRFLALPIPLQGPQGLTQGARAGRRKGLAAAMGPNLPLWAPKG